MCEYNGFIYVINSLSKSLSKLNKSDDSVTAVSINLPNTSPSDIYLDGGFLYIIDDVGNNILKFNPIDDTYTVVYSVSNRSAKDMCVDDNCIYSICDNKYILKTNKSTQITSILSILNSGLYVGIYSDVNYVYIGVSDTVDKLLRIEKSTDTIISINLTETTNNFRHINGDENYIYCFCSSKLYKVLKSDMSFITITINCFVRSSYIDATDIYTISTLSGVNNLYRTSKSTNETTIITIPHGYASTICGDNNNVYIGGFSYNLTRIEKSNNNVTTIATNSDSRYVYNDDTHIYVCNSNSVLKVSKSDYTFTSINIVKSTQCISGDSDSVYIGSTNGIVVKIKKSDNSFIVIDCKFSNIINFYHNGNDLFCFTVSGVAIINKLNNTRSTTICFINSILSKTLYDNNYFYILHNSSTYNNIITHIRRINKLTGEVLLLQANTLPNDIGIDSDYLYTTCEFSTNITKIKKSDNTISLIPIERNGYQIHVDNDGIYVIRGANINNKFLARLDKTSYGITAFDSFQCINSNVLSDDNYIFLCSNNNVYKIKKSDFTYTYNKLNFMHQLDIKLQTNNNLFFLSQNYSNILKFDKASDAIEELNIGFKGIIKNIILDNGILNIATLNKISFMRYNTSSKELTILNIPYDTDYTNTVELVFKNDNNIYIVNKQYLIEIQENNSYEKLNLNFASSTISGSFENNSAFITNGDKIYKLGAIINAIKFYSYILGL